MEPQNVVHHIADLFIAHDHHAQNNLKLIHQVKFNRDFCDSGGPSSPHFTLDHTGFILEYPTSMVRVDRVFDWLARQARGEMMQDVSPPDGCCVHNDIQAFAKSVFKRFDVDWNSVFDDDDSEFGAAILNVYDLRTSFFEGGISAHSVSESYVFLAANKTSQENGKCVKEHFVKLLTDLQAAVWAISNE